MNFYGRFVILAYFLIATITGKAIRHCYNISGLF